jgi:putative SOS response-associated peptidase YedK
MCGRFLNNLPAAEVVRFFGIRNALPNYPARFNIAPTNSVLIVRLNTAAVILLSRSVRSGP